MKKIKLLTPLFGDLRTFFLALTKKWLFWIFLILDVIALVIQFVNPNFRLGQIYYIGFALIGFIWSSFEVYRELLNEHRKSLPVKLNPISNLLISYVEGNEYEFNIQSPFRYTPDYYEKDSKKKGVDFRIDENGIMFIDNKIYYEMPKCFLFINFRIENAGDLPVDILDINIKVSNGYSSVSIIREIEFYQQELAINKKEVGFPLLMSKGDIFLVEAMVKIMRNSVINNAQFASAFRDLKKNFQVTTKIEALDEDGKKKLYETNLSVSTRPLIDLYINQWRQYSQVDYLRLAGFD